MTRAYRDYTAPVSGESVDGLSVEEPVAGFYRCKIRSGGAYAGVRLFYGPPLDPVTGEELDRSWRWQADANGEPIEFERVWPKCAGEPISAAEYRAYCRQQIWAKKNAPTSALADPRRRHDPLTSTVRYF